MNARFLCCSLVGIETLIALALCCRATADKPTNILPTTLKFRSAVLGIHDATRPAQLTSAVVNYIANKVIDQEAPLLMPLIEALAQTPLERAKDLQPGFAGMLPLGMHNLFTRAEFDKIVKMINIQTVSQFTALDYTDFYSKYSPPGGYMDLKTLVTRIQDGKISKHEAAVLILVPLLLDKQLQDRDKQQGEQYRLLQAPDVASLEATDYHSALTNAWLRTFKKFNGVSAPDPTWKATSYITVVTNLLLFNDALTLRLPAERQKLLQTVSKTLEDVSKRLQAVPLDLFTLKNDTVSVAGTVASTTELRYSNDEWRSDIGIQLIEGDIHGGGGRLLYDPSDATRHIIDAARNSHETAKSAHELLQKTNVKGISHASNDDFDCITHNFYQAIVAKDHLIDATIDAYLAQRNAISVSGQHIDEYGTILDTGYDISQLFSFNPAPVSPYKDYPGLSYTLSLHGSYYGPNSDLPERLAPDIGLAIAWQNAVPFHEAPDPRFEPAILLSPGKQLPNGDYLLRERVRHWSVQTGIIFHYYMPNDPNPGGSAGLFVRYRDRKHYLEVSAQAGIAQDQSGYFGAGVSWSP